LPVLERGWRRFGPRGVLFLGLNIRARGRVVDHVIGVVDPGQLTSGARAVLRGRILGTASGGAQRPQR
jgi:hypothetical protein